VVALDHWTGFYAGVNVGYSWGHARPTLTATEQAVDTITTTTLGGTVLDVVTIPGPTTTTALSARSKMDGFLGGGQIGYNVKFNMWLVGIETDIQGTGQRGSTTLCFAVGCTAGTPFVTADYKLRWFGTLRGRAGWLVDDNLLLYATGGLAYGEIGGSFALGTNGGALAPVLAGFNSTRVGWVVGAGGEYRFSERWSVKLEYLYMDLGSTSSSVTSSVTSPALIFTVGDRRLIGVRTTTTTAGLNTRFTDNIVRAGLNYRF
jgi:outer membrane immunogenic protein